MKMKDKNIKVNFMDVMKIISNEETTVDQKMVYIYILNVIMDIDEKIQKISKTLKEIDEDNKFDS